MFNIAELTSGIHFIKGVTYFIMTVIRGMPAVEQGTVPPIVSTAPAEVAGVATNKWEFTSISDAESNTTVYENIPRLTIPTVVNIGSGGITSVQFA
jgi:hypothetical protein